MFQMTPCLVVAALEVGVVAGKVLDVVHLIDVLRQQARVAEPAGVEVAEVVLETVAVVHDDASQYSAPIQRDNERLRLVLNNDRDFNSGLNSG